MNPVAPLRSPVAMLTALALLCGTLAIVLALSTPASALTRHGTFTLTPASGTVAAGPVSLTAAGPCPTPADAAKPYVKGVLALVNPGDPTLTAPLAEVVPGGPLGTTPISGALGAPGTGFGTLQERLREIVPSGPMDGRYELRLFCETADAETRAEYFSQLIEVTGDDWAAVGQQATNLTVSTDSALPPAGRPFPVRAEVQPATAAGTVTFLTLDSNGEPVELGTKELVDGKAEVTATMPDTVNLDMAVLAQFTPADPAAYTAASYLAVFTAGPATTPTPTGTPTGEPTATGTPTGTPTGEPTDGPTDEPTDGPTDEPAPADSTGPTPTATDTDSTGGSGTSGGTDTSGGSGGDSGSGSTGGTTTHGGNGSLAATGSTAASAALGSLALCLLGAAAVIQTRRRKGGARP
ncbi:PT domain-containing protein [Streptomyces sp. NPDC001728]|uniref:PT domain-containing protein n=1 Tax=Streptomyces sp. NPDC001728 TaxID=3154396 RepID=UPI00332D00C6